MISQPEYDCPAQRENDPQKRVLIRVCWWLLLCSVALSCALLWVMLA